MYPKAVDNKGNLKSGLSVDKMIKEDTVEEAVSPEEKAQLALKHAKELETLKKKHEREKENMKEDVNEAKPPKIKGLSIYGSEISGLKQGMKTFSAKPVVNKGKLGYRVVDEFGGFETLDLKAFARKFG